METKMKDIGWKSEKNYQFGLKFALQSTDFQSSGRGSESSTRAYRKVDLSASIIILMRSIVFQI